jgi:hypothetical protein
LIDGITKIVDEVEPISAQDAAAVVTVLRLLASWIDGEPRVLFQQGSASQPQVQDGLGAVPRR